jgi:hypothetical protein
MSNSSSPYDLSHDLLAIEQRQVFLQAVPSPQS